MKEQKRLANYFCILICLFNLGCKKTTTRITPSYEVNEISEHEIVYSVSYENNPKTREYFIVDKLSTRLLFISAIRSLITQSRHKGITTIRLFCHDVNNQHSIRMLIDDGLIIKYTQIINNKHMIFRGEKDEPIIMLYKYLRKAKGSVRGQSVNCEF